MRVAALLMALSITGGMAFSALALPTIAPPAWPQAQSDLAPDPAVRFGILSNGLRYAIMRNATPAGATSLRLRIGSGSLEESDAEQGLAHMVEHMAFRGSKNVPQDEMIKILQRDGLAFGPDTNAQTEWTQTVYKLDIPHTTPDILDTVLMLLRETASNLLIDPAALETERGVVLSEERLRDTPNYRASKAQIDLFLHGQLAAKRFPIGQVDVIKTAPASLVRAFYEANYRPERATLIVTGDVDPATIEAKIKTLFGDWVAKGPATADPDLGKIESRGLTVRQIPLPGASTQAGIAWARPFDDSSDTEAKEVRETIENLALAVLNRRLGRLAQDAHPPFLAAGAGFQNLFGSAKIAVVEAISAPDAWPGSLSAADREIRQLIAYGVSQPELDREISDMRTALQNSVAGAATRPTPTLADEIVRTVNDKEVFTPPSEDLRTFEDAVKGLDPARVDAAIKAIFAGAGPLVLVASPNPIAGGEAEVRQVFETASTAPLTAQVAQASVTWPYADFGPAGAVTSRKTLEDLGVTEVTFANGVRLNVKPTDFRKDQVLVAVDVGSGRLGLPTDRPSATWSAPALALGGFGKLTLEDANRALTGKIVSASFDLADGAFTFKGATRPEDLASELQFIGAYIRDPGYRPEAFERLRSAYLSALPQLDAVPAGVLQRESGRLLASGDPRFAFPSREALTSAKLADLKALVGEALAHGRLEVTIVGDVTVDQAVDLTARTLGALPARETAPGIAPGADKVRFPGPTPTPVMLKDTGRPDQAMAVIAWPMSDEYADLQVSRAETLAGDILENRLLETLRNQQGVTYSPKVGVKLSRTFPGYGYALSQVEMPPAAIPAFFQTARAIAADMAAKGVTPDELARAKSPRVADLGRSRLTNEYWLTALGDVQADPRRLDQIRGALPGYEKLTPADIQAAARGGFKAETAWTLEVTAEAPAPTRTSP